MGILEGEGSDIETEVRAPFQRILGLKYFSFPSNRIPKSIRFAS